MELIRSFFMFMRVSISRAISTAFVVGLLEVVCFFWLFLGFYFCGALGEFCRAFLGLSGGWGR